MAGTELPLPEFQLQSWGAETQPNPFTDISAVNEEELPTRESHRKWRGSRAHVRNPCQVKEKCLLLQQLLGISSNYRLLVLRFWHSHSPYFPGFQGIWCSTTNHPADETAQLSQLVIGIFLALNRKILLGPGPSWEWSRRWLPSSFSPSNLPWKPQLWQEGSGVRKQHEEETAEPKFSCIDPKSLSRSPFSLPSMRTHPVCCEGAAHPLACSVIVEMGRGRSRSDVIWDSLAIPKTLGKRIGPCQHLAQLLEQGGSMGWGGSSPLAEQRCDGSVTCWWVQRLKKRHVCQGAWEVLRLGLSVHPVHCALEPSCRHGALPAFSFLMQSRCLSPLAALQPQRPLGPFLKTARNRQAHNILTSQRVLFVRQPAPCYGAGGTVQ